MSDERRITFSITGPVAMLESMANTLRDEGYIVQSPGAESPTAVEVLHRALDLLLAQYLLDHPDALPSKTSVLDLLAWSHARVERENAKG
jgi:hypothetical protein